MGPQLVLTGCSCALHLWVDAWQYHLWWDKCLRSKNEYCFSYRFDWSQSLVSSSSKRQHSCDSLELVCCHPRRRKLSTSEPLPEDLSFSTDCQCIHCFLHDSFPLTTIERSLIALNPSDLGNNIFFSFDLSSDEVNSVRQGNLRLCMYVVNRFADTWNLDSSRFRMIMNGVDVFSTQVNIVMIWLFSLWWWKINTF